MSLFFNHINEHKKFDNHLKKCNAIQVIEQIMVQIGEISFCDKVAFNIKSDEDTNIRVLLALAYRTHYGDAAFDRLGVPCSHFEVNGEGQSICTREVH
jgi:hypothetical protein